VICMVQLHVQHRHFSLNTGSIFVFTASDTLVGIFGCILICCAYWIAYFDGHNWQKQYECTIDQELTDAIA